MTGDDGALSLDPVRNVAGKDGSALGVWPVRDAEPARDRPKPAATAPSAP
jgi:hypothetical protein